MLKKEKYFEKTSKQEMISILSKEIVWNYFPKYIPVNIRILIIFYKLKGVILWCHLGTHVIHKPFDIIRMNFSIFKTENSSVLHCASLLQPPKVSTAAPTSTFSPQVTIIQYKYLVACTMVNASPRVWAILAMWPLL